ncbi:MAG: hypothetical protein IKM39_01640, partial [Clostridia bacterium]|nr:hypothetical protein [Clostridia bacterium]
MMVKADLLTRWKEPIRAGGKVLSLQLLSFTTGFFMARSQILNQYTPLGVAFTAGVTGEYTLTAAIGALLGYLIPTGGVNNIRYMGAVGICALMAWLLGNFFAPPKKPLFSAMAGGVGLLTVLLILNVAGEASATVAEIIGECLLTAGSAYFFCCSSQILQKGNTLLTPHETASCVIA